MEVLKNPSHPFTPGLGYVATPVGGVPPFVFEAAPSPPNPPGVTVVQDGMSADIDCPPGTPPGTLIQVMVKDGSNPPQKASASHMTG